MRPSHRELIEAFEAAIIRLVVAEVKTINQKLDRLLDMAKTQAEFDVELQDSINDITQALTDGQAAIDTAVQTIIDAINAGKTPADLQTEFDTLEAARQAFKTTIAAIPAQLPTTPTPPAP